MKLKFLLPYIAVTFLIFGFIFLFSTPQTVASSAGDVSIDAVPGNPSPNESVTVNLSSYVDDLNSVLISWSVDGKKSSSGIGKKSFSLNAPSLGGQTTVTATISLPDGDISETTVIKPSVTVLLWQANDSYVPPFYKGKAMPSPGSQVKVVALPEIKVGSTLTDPKNMTYSWQLDYENSQDSSGYGKNSFLYTTDILDSLNNVAVTAQTLDQKYSATANVNIATTEPKIEFYKDDPSLGTIWEQALSNGHQISGSEIVQAAPYFISPEDIRIPFLNFSWSINDAAIAVPSYNKNLLPLKADAGTSGTSKIKLEIDSNQSLTESATKEINVQF